MRLFDFVRAIGVGLGCGPLVAGATESYPASRAEWCGHPCNSNCPRRGRRRRRVRPSENRYRCTRGTSCGPRRCRPTPNGQRYREPKLPRDAAAAVVMAGLLAVWAPQAQLYRVTANARPLRVGRTGRVCVIAIVARQQNRAWRPPSMVWSAGYRVVGVAVVAVSSAGFGCGVKLNPSGSGTCRT